MTPKPTPAQVAKVTDAKPAPKPAVGWKDTPAVVIGDAPPRTTSRGGTKVSQASVIASPIAYALRHPARGKGVAPLSSLTPAHVVAMVNGGRIGNVEYPTDLPVGIVIFATAHTARQKGAVRRGDVLLHAAMSYATYLMGVVTAPESPSDPVTIRTARAFAKDRPGDAFTPAHAHRAMYGESAVYGRVQNG